MKSLPEFDGMLKTIVASTISGAQGWDAKIHDPVIASKPQMFIYVHDSATKWSWMVSVSRDEFQRVAKIGESLNAKRSRDVRDAVSSCITNLARKNAVAGEAEEEKGLGLAMCLYAGGTKTFQAAKRFKGGGHFCVILYRKDEASDKSILRPFALSGSLDRPIAIENFTAAIFQVAQMDAARHPEWLKGE